MPSTAGVPVPGATIASQAANASAGANSAAAKATHDVDESAPPEIVAPHNPSDQLVGMSAGEITRLLGLPRSLRRDPPAEVWQYASASCIMFVFLYEGQPADAAEKSKATKQISAARDWRVHYIETRSRIDSKPVPMPDCLNGLIDRRPLALGEG